MSEYLNLAVGLSIAGALGFIANLWYKNQHQKKEIHKYVTKEKIQDATKDIDGFTDKELIDLFNKLFPTDPKKRK